MFNCSLIEVVTKASLTVTFSDHLYYVTVKHALVTTSIKLQSNML
jgi:hypothetical protein